MSDSEFYENPASTSSMIIERAGKICYIERRVDPYMGKLALPGGFLDCGKESLEEAAKRELKEETNLDTDIEGLELLMVNSSPDRDPRGHVIDHVYIVKSYNGVPKAGDDAKELHWIPLDETPELAFDHNIAVKKYLNWRKCNNEIY